MTDTIEYIPLINLLNKIRSELQSNLSSIIGTTYDIKDISQNMLDNLIDLLDTASYIKNTLDYIDATSHEIKYVLEVSNQKLDELINIANKSFPITISSIFNQQVTANTDILPSYVEPNYSPTVFRIYACFNQSGILSVVRQFNNTTVNEILNSGINLNANCSYIFDIIVEDGESINLKYSVNATALCLKIVEVPKQ